MSIRTIHRGRVAGDRSGRTGNRLKFGEAVGDPRNRPSRAATPLGEPGGLLTEADRRELWRRNRITGRRFPLPTLCLCGD